ncbi:MAG TPA: hypothetical protein PKD49_00955 [Hyphomicrobium sp.]|nr:hypothetical protein [Hyphomicrobium sp.]
MSQAAPILPNKLEIETTLIEINANIETLLLVSRTLGDTTAGSSLTYLLEMLRKHVTELDGELGLGEDSH